MNDITRGILCELVPQMAIVVYGNGNKYYLERLDITDGHMGAGIPLTEECLAEIFNAISSTESNIPHGVIPENMLYADGRVGRERYVWYNKPGKRHLLFSKNADMPDGDALVPGLVYMASGATLTVFAFKGNTPKDKLFRAPFFNVYDTGVVCLGSAKTEKPSQLTYENIIRYWEKLFWASEFGNILSGNPVKGNLSTITKKCIKDGCPFPESELLPVKTKLKDLLR